jgi:hypothetical protein
MKRCLRCAYPLDFINSTACPECGRAFLPTNPLTYDHPNAPPRTGSFALTTFLICWPLAAFFYGIFLGLFEGIWGDPWYGVDWPPNTLSDVRAILFYPVIGTLVAIVCAAWLLLLILATFRDRRIRFTASRSVLVAVWCYGLIAIAVYVTLLNNILRTFFDEACAY